MKNRQDDYAPRFDTKIHGVRKSACRNALDAFIRRSMQLGVFGCEGDAALDFSDEFMAQPRSLPVIPCCRFSEFHTCRTPEDDL